QSNEVHYRRTFNRAREQQACARRHTRECSSYPTRIPRGYIEIRQEEEKMKRKKNRRREREEEKKQMRREESKSVRTREKDEAEKKRKKRISMQWNIGTCEKDEIGKKIWTWKRKEKKRHTRAKPEYENPDFDYLVLKEKDPENFGNILKNAVIRWVILAVYEFPMYHKSHRVEIAASGDPRTNGDSTFNYYYCYQESKATWRRPHQRYSTLIQASKPPCVSAFGNRLTHSSTIQHRKLRSPLEHDRSCFRDKCRNPKLNLPQSRYLREHSENTHANMLNATPTPLPANISECPSILPERVKRTPSTPESLDGPWVMQRLLHLERNGLTRILL
ncbi:LOW QUALITY PROTEIN: hypothetical protein V1477_001028, partial [Vespula maculifrons]